MLRISTQVLHKYMKESRDYGQSLTRTSKAGKTLQKAETSWFANVSIAVRIYLP